MIEVRNLRKEYEEFVAVNNVDLNVGEGCIYGLLGSNGAGKTTLLKTLAGLYRPEKGEVKIFGEKVYENTLVKQEILFVSDELYFYPSYTIKEMAKFYRGIYPNWSEEKFMELGKIFPINPKQKIHRLSKGMKRQVALWLSLSAMPKLLILDEPLDGLDSFMRQKVKKLLFEEVADRSMSIVISSHNLRELEDLCDHVGILHQGKMVLERDLDELKSDIHKVQFALGDLQRQKMENQGVQLNVNGYLLGKKELKILSREQQGSILLWMIKGSYEDIMKAMEEIQPPVLDVLPLTLEEVFIYEMGELSHEINASIFQ